MKKLSYYKDSRDNNFNLIRFTAAFLVLVSHSFPLATGRGDSEPLYNLIGIGFGHIAVDIFFITSGFLITGSLLRSNSIKKYITARVLRIYPAIFIAVSLTVLVLGPALTSVSLKEYFSHQTVIYFFKNISLIFGVEFQLPGVFENVPWKNAVNGSLWTLPYEVKMYAYLLGIFVVINVLSKYLSLRLLGNFSFKKIIALIAISSVLFQFYLMLQNKEHTDFFRLFSFFFIGSFFYCYADKIPMKSIYLTISSLLLICTATYQYLFMEFYSLLLPYLVFSIAYIPKGRIRKFNDFGDYSYGFYIYAFPVNWHRYGSIPLAA